MTADAIPFVLPFAALVAHAKLEVSDDDSDDPLSVFNTDAERDSRRLDALLRAGQSS